MKRSYVPLAVLLLLLGTLPLAAQEQTGSIEGLIKDSTGAVIPGVTVEATSPAAGTVTTVTDSNGRYRFPRLPSGRYEVKANLMGYNSAASSDVNVTLGKVQSVDLTLRPAAVAETITVTAAAPIIDVTQSATSTSIAREQLEMIPKGRDFTSVVAQAAGASNEAFLGGISIDGASGSENRFVIDGIDTTHPADGLSGQNLITDFVEEVQVKSAGYAAEFGGSVGGVINAVTKTGTNSFNGSAGLYYGDRGWDGAERRTPYRSDPTLYRLFKEDDIKRVEPFISLGGPIMRDRLWFYLGYSQSEFETNRVPTGQSTTYTTTDTRRYLTGNLKGNIGSRFLFKLSGNSGPREIDNTLPARDGSTPRTALLDIDSEFVSESYSAYADFFPTTSFFVSGRAGRYKNDTQSAASPAGTPRIFFRNGVIPVPTTDPRYRPTGFATVPGSAHFGTEFDVWQRESGSLDANLFLTAFGQHSLKGGVQYETVSNQVALGEVGNLYEIRWGLPDRIGAGVIGTYGSVHVRRFGTFGAAESNNLGFYLQDAWQVRPNLTLNLGVRTEKEEVPNYGHGQDPSLPVNAFEFGYGDKLAPRLGFAWDVMDNAKWKVYGSWGLYYDIMKIEMSRGSFGGDRWIGYAYPLNTLDWSTLPNGCTTSVNDPTKNPCPALGTPVTRDLRHPTDPRDPVHGVDPNLRPFEQEEYQLGVDHMLTTNSSLGFRYVNKKVNAAIEDIGFFTCTTPTQCEESYFVGNPGLGPTANDPPGPIPGQPKAKRDYQGFEVSYNRSFVNNWSARIGYTHSKLEGNWSGLGSSDEFGRTDPNVSRSFDYLFNSFNQQGEPVYGALNTDRPHQIDAQFLYRAPWKTTLGVNQYFGSGTPISTQVQFNAVPFFAFGRGDQGRTGNLTQTDLLITHPVSLGPVRLEASLNVLNLFDEDTAVAIDPLSNDTDLCSALASLGCTAATADTFFFTTLKGVNRSQIPTNNPFYLKPNSLGGNDPFQARRTLRVGLKVTF